VNYKFRFEGPALHHVNQLPGAGMDALIEALLPILEDPYRLPHSRAISDNNHRWAGLADNGFIQFKVNDKTKTIAIYTVVWLGGYAALSTGQADRDIYATLGIDPSSLTEVERQVLLYVTQLPPQYRVQLAQHAWGLHAIWQKQRREGHGDDIPPDTSPDR
jgi:hypothetical protein